MLWNIISHTPALFMAEKWYIEDYFSAFKGYQFSLRCLPKCAIDSHWFYTDFMSRFNTDFMSRFRNHAFADWPEINEMDYSPFRYWVGIQHVGPVEGRNWNCFTLNGKCNCFFSCDQLTLATSNKVLIIVSSESNRVMKSK